MSALLLLASRNTLCVLYEQVIYSIYISTICGAAVLWSFKPVGTA